MLHFGRAGKGLVVVFCLCFDSASGLLQHLPPDGPRPIVSLILLTQSDMAWGLSELLFGRVGLWGGNGFWGGGG